ncbi:MAG: hypothetical protein K0R80_3455 [Clostridia bacterium]|jgi:hypothetical protein|nr:hypothetical protein [Clostridia bacterium]
MKMKSFKIIMLIALLLLLIVNATIFEKKKEASFNSLPSLPKPIAKEYALITSAGQGTDAYIINDIANKMMIHNYFMPQAEATNLEGINTLVFVVGYSPMGEKIHNVNYVSEKKRIIALLEKSNEENITVITVYIGGKQQREKRTEELLNIISPETDYLIGTKAANTDGFLSELAKSNRIPLTLINGVNDLSEPFASAFR